MAVFESLLERYPELDVCLGDLEAAFQLIYDTFHTGGKLLVCGNGGSAADSEHIVGELMKGYFSRRPITEAQRKQILRSSPLNGAYLADHLQGALPAISLVSQVALISAFANDVSPDMVYAQQVFGYGRPGDVLIGISTSGVSTNVTHAIQVARAVGLSVVGFTGGQGGAMRDLCTVTICAPGKRTPDIQQYHQVLYHALCQALEEAFFPG